MQFQNLNIKDTKINSKSMLFVYNDNMKKFLILICILIFGIKSSAFNIVYPKNTNVTINANSTFFIGSSQTPLTVNGQNVPLHKTGAFAYVVKLNSGKNTFVICSGNQSQTYTITKPAIKFPFKPQQFVQYNKKRSFYVSTEGSPLRSSPFDGGINRMAHLQNGVPLLVDGEKNWFYRVVLSENNYGWISKSNVKEFKNFEITPAKFLGYDYIDSRDYFTFVFHLDKQVPYEIVEGDVMSIKFFNTNEVCKHDFPYKEAANGKKLIGYKGHYEGNDFILQIRKPLKHKKIKNIKIAVDAGHGGYEKGAIGCLGDEEKDITLKISKYLEKELKSRGAKVIMTRTDDKYVGLKERVDIANENDAAIFVSIHANALPDGLDPNKISGTSVFYYYNEAKPLADTVLNTMLTELKTNDDKVRQASFAVVRNTNALSILIETAYLINPDDNEKLVNPEFQKACAKAIADGIEKYFSAQ